MKTLLKVTLGAVFLVLVFAFQYGSTDYGKSSAFKATNSHITNIADQPLKIGTTTSLASLGTDTEIWLHSKDSGTPYFEKGTAASAFQEWWTVGFGGSPSYGGRQVSSLGVHWWAGASPVSDLAIAANGNVTVAHDLSVTGTLSKGAGSFKIINPIDSTEYLYHSFAESPTMMNIYDGTVMLDAEGRAKVFMPDYFWKLNANFRYQLTSLGSSQPGLFVKEIIENTSGTSYDGSPSSASFIIEGGAPGGKVSWQVTGERIDEYAVNNRIQVREKI